MPLSAAEFANALATLDPAPRLAVACSGGADSLALTLLAAAWAKTHGRSLTALTVDHGLRPESAAEAEATAAWLKAAGVAHHILRWTGPKPRANRAARAREARYRLLFAYCRQCDIPDLLLAHHLEDQAETFLLRLARGSGVDGLAAMAPSRRQDGVRLLRPLLDVPRARLKSYLRARGQSWIEDPSNADLASARVRMRALSPRLAAEGLTATRLAKTAARMARVKAALDLMADRLIERAVRLDPAGFCRLDPGLLADAPAEIGLRALSRVLLAVSGAPHPPRLRRLERLYGTLVAGDLGGGATLQGCRLLPWQGGVLVCREARGMAGAQSLSPGEAVLWDNRFEVALTVPEGKPQAVRAARAGVFVAALGAAGVRSVRAEIPPERIAAVPAAVRPTLPTLWNPQGVVAVPHLGFQVPGLENLGFRAEFRPRWPLFAASGNTPAEESPVGSNGDIV